MRLAPDRLILYRPFMGLQFSQAGPDFPTELVDDLIAGQVVFLCGAGVSAPQLPDFLLLVEQVYERVKAEMSASETVALAAGRPEEALGSLSRRLADRRAVRSAVDALLLPKNGDLAHHTVLLRLSRSLDNRLALITTNFDPLFERALDAAEGAGSGKSQSLAGQALPSPGSNDFGGVIHLHGRIADPASAVEGTPLVLTSSEYGEAYMRAGWAARFLFELVRCRTLVLVGYAAGDAPMRYFLNLLEADRERFPDVKKVYALDAIDAAGKDRWSSVAVRPLLYQTSQETGHSALWADLQLLADLVERPKAWRREKVREVLSKPFEEASSSERAALDWSIRQHRDLWDVVIGSVRDHRWFDHLSAQQLWEGDDAAWVIAAWCALDWTDPIKISTGLSWHLRLGLPFGSQIERLLGNKPPENPLYRKAWRVIAGASRLERDDLRAFLLTQRLAISDIFDSDLQRAVDILRPRAQVRDHWSVDDASVDDGPAAPTRLWQLFSVSLTVDDRGYLTELSQALARFSTKAGRITELATEALRRSIALAHDVDLIDENWDRLDTGVPTVIRHAQNEYHDGAVFLVQLLTDIYPALSEASPERARIFAQEWRDLESQLGSRLWLYALCEPKVFRPDAAAQAVLDLPHRAFWTVKRELVLLIAGRFGGADPALCEAVCSRIICEGRTLYTNMETEEGRRDWRPLARDHDVWLRLTALRQAGVLPEAGRLELEAIAARQPAIQGNYKEEDLFGSYSHGVQWIKGDATPLVEAEPAERLEIARKFATNWDPKVQQSWSTFCSSDPSGALDSLRGETLTQPNVGLWNDLLGALSWLPSSADDAAKAERGRLGHEVFELFGEADTDFLSAVTPRLVELYGALQHRPEGWWDRLWKLVELDTDPVGTESGSNFIDRVINHPAGKLAEQLLVQVGQRTRAGRPVRSGDRARLRLIFQSTSPAGWYGRALAVSRLGYVHGIAPTAAVSLLRPLIRQDNQEGRVLRSVLVEVGDLSAKATKAFKEELLQGVIESQVDPGGATRVASVLVFPIMRQALYDKQPDWGLTREDVRKALRRCSPAVLGGAAECLRRWVTPTDKQPSEAWSLGVAPVFQAIWPGEAEFQRASQSGHLAAMAVLAGELFPQALNAVLPYLKPYEGDWLNIHFMVDAPAVSAYPRVALELLWAICGPGTKGQSTELGGILDRLVQSEPALAVDRRLQWLESRSVRYS